jgi:hypothetical protein
MVWFYSSFYYFEMHDPPDLGYADQVQLTAAQVFYKISAAAAWSALFAVVIACCSFCLVSGIWGKSVGRGLKLTLALIVWLIVVSGSVVPSYEFFSQRAHYFAGKK